MLISTFQPKAGKNLISFTQSAGNLYTKSLKSSSEITRDTSFDFTLFKIFYSRINQQHLALDPVTSAPDFNWLTWFIGFSEGDGAILTYKGRPTFVITQKEKEILLHIQKVLGFGIVREYKSFSRYFVLDKQNIYLLTLLFNGNLVLEHRKSQLSYWIQALNKTIASNKPALKNKQSLWTVDLSEINLIDKLIKPTLNDAWLSGFTDAEGCFNVKIEKRSNTVTGFRVMLRFILDQKNSQQPVLALSKQGLFLQLRDLFSYGAVSLRGETNGVYRYQVNSFKGLIPIRNYFLNFSLKSKKLLSFQKWNEIYKMVLNKEHLLEKGLTSIRELSKNININNSLNRKTGSAKPK